MGKYPGITLKPMKGNVQEFGKYYSGSTKHKQMKRKKQNLIGISISKIKNHNIMQARKYPKIFRRASA